MKDPKENLDLGQSDEGASAIGGETTPEFLNPKFKNTEEQAKAYNEAEKAMTVAQQSTKRLQDKLDTIEQDKVNIEEGKKIMELQEKAPTTPEFWNKWIQDPVGTIQEEAGKIAQKLVAPLLYGQRQNEIKTEIEDLARDNPDFKEIAPLAMEKIKQNPHLKNMPKGLTMAVGMVRSDQHREIIAKQSAERKGREDKGELSGGQTIKSSEIMGEGDAGGSSSGQEKTIEEKIADDFVKSGLGKNPELF